MVVVGFVGYEGYIVLWGFFKKKEYSILNIYFFIGIWRFEVSGRFLILSFSSFRLVCF